MLLLLMLSFCVVNNNSYHTLFFGPGAAGSFVKRLEIFKRRGKFRF